MASKKSTPVSYFALAPEAWLKQLAMCVPVVTLTCKTVANTVTQADLITKYLAIPGNTSRTLLAKIVAYWPMVEHRSGPLKIATALAKHPDVPAHHIYEVYRSVLRQPRSPARTFCAVLEEVGAVPRHVAHDISISDRSQFYRDITQLVSAGDVTSLQQKCHAAGKGYSATFVAAALAGDMAILAAFADMGAWNYLDVFKVAPMQHQCVRLFALKNDPTIAVTEEAKSVIHDLVRQQQYAYAYELIRIGCRYDAVTVLSALAPLQYANSDKNVTMHALNGMLQCESQHRPLSLAFVEAAESNNVELCRLIHTHASNVVADWQSVIFTAAGNLAHYGWPMMSFLLDQGLDGSFMIMCLIRFGVSRGLVTALVINHCIRIRAEYACGVLDWTALTIAAIRSHNVGVVKWVLQQAPLDRLNALEVGKECMYMQRVPSAIVHVVMHRAGPELCDEEVVELGPLCSVMQLKHLITCCSLKGDHAMLQRIARGCIESKNYKVLSSLAHQGACVLGMWQSAIELNCEHPHVLDALMIVTSNMAWITTKRTKSVLDHQQVFTQAAQMALNHNRSFLYQKLSKAALAP